jgi:sulfatase maturation enzyme AslB (radical SAM superfamily)
MNKPNMTKDNKKLLDEVKIHYTLWPQECLECNLKPMCSSCAAACYEENKTPQEYFAEKRMCGWTHAVALAKLYFQNRLEEKAKITLNNPLPKT